MVRYIPNFLRHFKNWVFQEIVGNQVGKERYVKAKNVHSYLSKEDWVSEDVFQGWK